MGKDKSPWSRREFNLIAKGIEAKELEIITLRSRIASLEEEVARLTRTKKRKAIPNPNKRFMTLGEALASEEGTREPREPQEAAEVEEDVPGAQESEPNEDGEDDFELPTAKRTRTGKMVKQPQRYEN